MPGKTALCKDGSPLVSGEVLSCIKDASVYQLQNLLRELQKNMKKLQNSLKSCVNAFFWLRKCIKSCKIAVLVAKLTKI